mmetsp:Transcript_30116/g.69497  ORF Transcript_30116/g.69497 Transcript_30116/m.69497 type:complete len:82 (-) Transcript_30116:898-1143(-)
MSANKRANHHDGAFQLQGRHGRSESEEKMGQAVELGQFSGTFIVQQMTVIPGACVGQEEMEPAVYRSKFSGRLFCICPLTM